MVYIIAHIPYRCCDFKRSAHTYQKFEFSYEIYKISHFFSRTKMTQSKPYYGLVIVMLWEISTFCGWLGGGTLKDMTLTLFFSFFKWDQHCWCSICEMVSLSPCLVDEESDVWRDWVAFSSSQSRWAAEQVLRTQFPDVLARLDYLESSLRKEKLRKSI